jgi:hypothetical protein
MLATLTLTLKTQLQWIYASRSLSLSHVIVEEAGGDL